MNKGLAHVNGTNLYYEMKGKGFPLVLISGRRFWIEGAGMISLRTSRNTIE